MSVKFCYEGHCSKSGLSGREISPCRCNRQAAEKAQPSFVFGPGCPLLGHCSMNSCT